jgi:hypothetical protein
MCTRYSDTGVLIDATAAVIANVVPLKCEWQLKRVFAVTRVWFNLQ